MKISRIWIDKGTGNRCELVLLNRRRAEGQIAIRNYRHVVGRRDGNGCRGNDAIGNSIIGSDRNCTVRGRGGVVRIVVSDSTEHRL